MMFARRVFTWAAVFGFVMIAPLFVAEGLLARVLHRTLTQPQWYYGFAEVALAFQALYLIIGRDPVRYRPLMPLCGLAKLGFGVVMWTLVGLGRSDPLLGIAAIPDMFWAAAFLLAYRLTAKSVA
jgi:hypothetical protein